MAGGSAAGVTVSDRAPPSVIVHESTEPRVFNEPRVEARENVGYNSFSAGSADSSTNTPVPSTRDEAVRTGEPVAFHSEGSPMNGEARASK